MNSRFKILVIAYVCIFFCGCSSRPSIYKVGTYGYDFAFFNKNHIKTVELSSSDDLSKVLVIPQWQGRVMTSTTGGNEGNSYGWINHNYIESGAVSKSFNPYGGEERFWIGPEGGPFSWYFKKNAEQIYDNWTVPTVLDTDPFDIESQSGTELVLTKHTILTNASDITFNIGIKRSISLLEKDQVSELLSINIPDNVKVLGYCTENTIENEGKNDWSKETGLPSIWLLGMLASTKTTTVFIPYNKDASGKIVNDEYFGKVPSDRLVVDDGIIYFKIDGEFRSKIGLPKESAKDIVGSYDSEKKILNILKFTSPEGEVDYVNSQWGAQDDPYSGDVINSYNDGPTDNGTIMGPFYEIETSSPAAVLKVGESMTHTQYTIHIEGSEEELAIIIKTVFGVEINQIANRFIK